MMRRLRRRQEVLMGPPTDRLFLAVLPDGETSARIAEKSPLALKLMKRAINNGADMTLPAGLAYESSMVSLAFDSEDAREGLGAFIEKRRPVFKGR